jgi:hypothetical protein
MQKNRLGGRCIEFDSLQNAGTRSARGWHGDRLEPTVFAAPSLTPPLFEPQLTSPWLQAALRKRVREKEEAEAARDLAVHEAEEYAAAKKRGAEESERRAKRARSEADEAEAEREAKRQRAEEEFRERVETLGLEEERRTVEKLREAIAEREKALEEGERKEADAVGALVSEQLAELQRKVNRIWDQQLGSPNGA